MFWEFLAALVVNQFVGMGISYTRTWYQRRALEMEFAKLKLSALNVIPLEASPQRTELPVN